MQFFETKKSLVNGEKIWKNGKKIEVFLKLQQVLCKWTFSRGQISFSLAFFS